MQNESGDIQLSALIDLLAIYTEEYSSMMRMGGRESKIKEHEDLILQLQAEIKARKSQGAKQADFGSGEEPVPVLTWFIFLSVLLLL